MKSSIITPTLMATSLMASALPAAAERDVNSGNFMLPYCKQWVETQRMLDSFSGVCAGTVATLSWTAPALEGPWRFCAPDGVTVGQLGRVVVGYLEKHPEKLHLEFRQLALDALKQAWPCK